MTYGDFIRNKRKECGFTQQELADKVGVARTTVIAWESEKFPPTDLNNISSLEQALSLETGTLYMKICSVNPTNPPLHVTQEQGDENAKA